MIDLELNELADEILDEGPSQVFSPILRQGIVQANDGTNLTIRIGGSTVDIPSTRALANAAYCGVGSVVWIAQQGPIFIILGRLGSGEPLKMEGGNTTVTGNFTYTGSDFLLAPSGSGNIFRVTGSNGAVEIGRYLDFHSDGNAASGDYTHRLNAVPGGALDLTSSLSSGGDITAAGYVYANYGMRLGEIFGHGGMYRAAPTGIWGTEIYLRNNGNGEWAVINGNGYYCQSGWIRNNNGGNGFYNEANSSGIYFPGTYIESYNSRTFKSKANAGNYTSANFLAESTGGAAQTSIAFHNQGYNAPIVKGHWSIGDKVECRNSVDSDFGYFRGYIENLCDVSLKGDLRPISVHAQEARLRGAGDGTGESLRSKARRIPVYRFKRPNAKTPCPVCLGDGIIGEDDALRTNGILDVHPEWADGEEEIGQHPDGRPMMRRYMNAGKVCPNCEGGTRDHRPTWVADFEDSDFIGTVAQDILKEFPEVITAGGEDGQVRGLDVGGFLGILLGMNQEQDDEIEALRTTVAEQAERIDALEARLARLEARLPAANPPAP